MKKFFNHVLFSAIIMGCMTMTSCGGEDDPVIPGSNLEEKTYSSTEGLKLTFNGETMIGKTVTFTPKSDNTATITLEGEKMDLNSLIGGTKSEQEIPSGLLIPTAGVIPGSPKLDIPITLIGDAQDCTFEGTSETEYCNFEYSGSINADNLKLNLTDVELKDQSNASKWNLTILKSDGFDYSGTSPITTLWKSSNKLEIEHFPGVPMEMSMETILSLVMSMPIVPNPLETAETKNISLTDLMPLLLKSVTLEKSGLVKAEYTDLENEAYPTVVSPSGIAQYVMAGEGKLLLFLNPQMIAANVIEQAMKTKSTRAADLTLLIDNLMTQLLPMIQNGIPVTIKDYEAPENMAYTPEPATSFVLGTEVLLPLLKTLAPILTDEEIINQIVEAASKDPSMGSMAGMLPGILKSLPKVIDATTRVEIGLNFVKE